MASRDEPLSGVVQLETLDKASVWFWNFLKSELAPYPGRASVVVRMTITATIVMLLIQTFRLPSGFLAGVFTFFLSRENPTATLRSGVRLVASFVLATAYTVLGIATLVDEPLTHFLWIVVTLFIAFYLIRILSDYLTAVGFGFMTAAAIPIWDQSNITVNTRIANTLWVGFVVLVGSAVTIAVEYLFRRLHPTTDLTEGIETRLETVEGVLRRIAADSPLDPKQEKSISRFADVGTSRLRRLLLRSNFGSNFIAAMNAAVALLGRLVDLTASLQTLRTREAIAASEEDRKRCLRVADEIAVLRRDLLEQRPPRRIDIPLEKASDLPILPAIERTVTLIPQAFSESTGISGFFIPAPMEEEVRPPLIVRDAFSNPTHLQFALRGMLSAVAAYMIYSAIDWRGLNTSIQTCIITALSTIGASRQKQFLRLAGVIIGGVVFGMGGQVFVLPYLDSIAGFTVFFVIVTAIAAWIATSSSRLSYLGVMLAFGFFLVNLQEFTIQTSLSVARDRVFGVLLGLMTMWLIFDRLWVRSALEEMQAVFARNLQLVAEFTEQLLKEDRTEATKRMRQLRDQLDTGFEVVRAQGDAILFEFGALRRQKLKIRNQIRNWQPELRTLVLVEVTLFQYRVQRPFEGLPESVDQARIAFLKDCAQITRAMADDVCGNPSRPVPDVAASEMHFEQEIRTYYESQKLAIPPVVSDVISLAQNFSSILVSLYRDMHSTLAGAQRADLQAGLEGAATG